MLFPCGATGGITQQKAKPEKYWCKYCRKYFNAWTRTPLEYGKVELSKWTYAAYLMMTPRKGIFFLKLSKKLEVTQTTEWYILHRLREVYLGDREDNKHASKKVHDYHFQEKQIIPGMRERDGKSINIPIEHADKSTLHGAVHTCALRVLPSTLMRTFSTRSVAHRHKTVSHSAKKYVNSMVYANGIESVWAVLKRGFNGVYHNWSKKHCRQYVNEFTFRLNQGNCEHDTRGRLDDITHGMVGKTVTYEELSS